MTIKNKLITAGVGLGIILSSLGCSQKEREYSAPKYPNFERYYEAMWNQGFTNNDADLIEFLWTHNIDPINPKLAGRYLRLNKKYGSNFTLNEIVYLEGEIEGGNLTFNDVENAVKSEYMKDYIERTVMERAFSK